MTESPRLGLFFNYDWDALGFAAHAGSHRFDTAGFDLFSFPSNARILGFDLERFADQQARRGQRLGWQGVASHHEQYGALAAALVAERLGLPGTPVAAILACQHKLHARRVLKEVCPEACVPFAGLDARYGADIPALPEGLNYPIFVKPIKAAFSVLARRVENRAQLQQHAQFGWRELWVIRRLVEPFDRVARRRLPSAGTAHRLLLEEPVQAEQFNLDGWVFKGQAHALGVVDAIMYPGTQAFMRWDHPSQLKPTIQARALDVARRFLAAVGFTHGLFNMEFFYDAANDRLTVIEFNPRLASQFSDLYQRVLGIDPHAMTLALALGRDPALLPRAVPTAGAVSSLVYRSFDAATTPPPPSAAQRAAFKREFPDGLLFCFPKHGHSLERDFKWLGSHRYGIAHLGGQDEADLRRRATAASALLGWPAPYVALAAAVSAAPASADATHAKPSEASPAPLAASLPTLFTPGAAS
jgi:ATP-grasp domain